MPLTSLSHLYVYMCMMTHKIYFLYYRLMHNYCRIRSGYHFFIYFFILFAYVYIDLNSWYRDKDSFLSVTWFFCLLERHHHHHHRHHNSHHHQYCCYYLIAVTINFTFIIIVTSTITIKIFNIVLGFVNLI